MKMTIIQLKLTLAAVIFVTLFSCCIASKAKQDFISRFEDVKEFKKFIKTHKNVLVVFSKTEKDFKDGELLNQVGESIKGKGSVVHIDCTKAKKLCKKYKANPRTVEFKHFKDGDFHKVYDRLMTSRSLEKFMLDPSGDIPWEEDNNAKDVTHLEKMNDFKKLLTKQAKPLLVMFYAPWCGFCKKLKPEYAAAASVLKQEAVLVGVDVDTSTGEPFKTQFNITAYPTIVYFKNGAKQFDYSGDNNKEGIIKWMRNPHAPQAKEPEKEWADIPSDVIHLNDDNFHDVINQGQSTLVMFYAPWCGHCKTMKPEYQDAAAKIKQMGLGGVLAAVDGTKEKKIMDNFTISGFPTVKFFQEGKEQYDVQDRTSAKIVEFMKNPQKPVAAEAEVDIGWEGADSGVEMLGADDFKGFIKKKKHSLVMFYTPWCGHCKKTKPEFTRAAQAFKGDTKKAFAAVDCSVHGQFCQDNEVKGYPTIMSYTYGKDPQIYKGARESKDFISLMGGQETTPPPPTPKTTGLHWDDLENNQIISMLDHNTFDAFISSSAFAVVSFYGSTCSHCHAMREDFIGAALQLQKEKVEAKFAAVDAMKDDVLRKRFFISNLPTIKAFRNGVELIEFDDIPRVKKNFMEYVKNPFSEATSYSAFRPQKGMLMIDSESLLQSFLTTHKSLFVFFHDPSNIKCLRARAAFWDSASEAEIQGAKLAVVNCVQQGDMCKREAVSDVPTFKLYLNSKFHSDFKSTVSVRAFADFLKQAVVKEKVEL